MKAKLLQKITKIQEGRQAFLNWNKKNQILILFVCMFVSPLLFAEGKGNEMTEEKAHYFAFDPQEKIKFDVYFKWGILMPKAGEATLSMKNDDFLGKDVYKQQLLFKTTSMFDKIYKMRDTVESYTTRNLESVFYQKRVNEGGYYLVDETAFNHKKVNPHVMSKRFDRNRVKFDTLMVCSQNQMFDMLNISLFFRGMNFSNLQVGEERTANVVVGRDIIKSIFRYDGQAIVERDNVKYKTLKITVDIFDEAFQESKEALEIWVSDDKNRVPIKIRAKLKIGAAEVYLSSLTGNIHPFSARIEVPKR